jgi:hypothetical protein
LLIVAGLIIWLCGKSLNIKQDGISSITISDYWTPLETEGRRDSGSVEATSDEEIKACLEMLNSIKLYHTNATEAIERSPAVIIHFYDSEGKDLGMIYVWDGNKLGYFDSYGKCVAWNGISSFDFNKIHKFCCKYAKHWDE